MKKFFFFLTLCLAFSFYAQAQISEGQPRKSVIKTGNRPQKGDFGFYIGPSYTEIRDLIDWADKSSNVDFVRGLPLCNLKYYISNSLEFRAGIQWYGKTTSYNGVLMVGDQSGDSKGSNSLTRFRINPGIAYHFTTKNILDVYVGAEIPLGCDVEKICETYGNTTVKSSRNSPVIGLGAFFGFQVFVADLPFAIGLEVGLSGLARCGQKIKHVVTTETESQTFYTRPGDNSQYSKLKSNTFESGADARITFSYFFNNKK